MIILGEGIWLDKFDIKFLLWNVIIIVIIKIIIIINRENWADLCYFGLEVVSLFLVWFESLRVGGGGIVVVIGAFYIVICLEWVF